MTNNNVQVGAKELGGIQESDEDKVDEYLGYLTFSTTGEALVPREWLLNKWEEYGLPVDLKPKQPSNWSAYRRTMSNLLDDSEARHYSIYSDEYGRSFDCKFDMEKSDEMGSNVFIVYAKTFFPEEIIDEEGGNWSTKRLGHFNFFRPEDDMPGQLITNTDIDKGDVHYEHFKSLMKEANNQFKTMKTHHNYADLQKVTEKFRSRSNAVPIRRAVYFVGAHHEDTVDALSKLWNDMNEYKEDGEVMRIETTPVINLESQREMIAERAESMVRDIVDDIVSETMEQFADEDQTADETSREILDQLTETYDIQAEYNNLLSMKLSVKDILKEKREQMKDEQEEIIDRVINQTTLDEQ